MSPDPRGGQFVWEASDHSADVASDTRQGIFIAPASDPTGSSGAWVRVHDGGINPYWFGASGVGTDDVAALSAAAIQAKRLGDVLLIPPGVFGISQYIHILNGVRGVIGLGGTIKILSSATIEAGLLLRGKADGAAENVKNCRIDGLIIDMNSKAGVGINCQNSSDCIITRNRIINATAASYGIAVRAYAAGLDATGGNVITENVIENGNSTPGTAAIAVDCEFTGDATTYWKAHFAPRPISVANRNNIIANNSTDGFGYGFEGDGLSNSLVSGNCFRNNTERGMIVAHGASGLNIVGNVIVDCHSSGIHLTYGTNNCLVKGNIVRTSANNGGEALLQAYVGATDNLFEGNKLAGLHATGPQYHIYFAVHASRNVALDNDCYGQCTKAYVAIENAWNTTTTCPMHAAAASRLVNSGQTPHPPTPRARTPHS